MPPDSNSQPPSGTPGSRSARRPGSSAWGSRGAWAVLLVTMTLGVVADLATKFLAFQHIAGTPVYVDRADVMKTGGSLSRLVPAHEPVVVVPRMLELTLVLNPGAVFGIGAGKRWFFVGFTAGAIVFALWMFANWTTTRDRAAHVAVGLLLAGGLGNLYDRLMFACVRDFLHPLPGIPWPFGWTPPWGAGGRDLWPYVSNVADLLLIIGIAMLVWHTWRAGARQSRARTNA